MLVYSEDSELSSLVEKYFMEAFPVYNVTISEGTVDDVKMQIASDSAECAFVMDSVTSYTYYVNNLAMYDSNTAVANAVLQEAYRVAAMIQNGMTPEQAGEIMSVQIESNITALGKYQIQNFFYTYIMIFVPYMVILFYGQMVATNVATEISSRAMEILITSAKPANMMFGKVLASCTAGRITSFNILQPGFNLIFLSCFYLCHSAFNLLNVAFHSLNFALHSLNFILDFLNILSDRLKRIGDCQ